METQIQLESAAAGHNGEAAMKTTLNRLEALKDLIQEAVDKGVTSVEQVHRAIADLPFTALEQSGVKPAKAEQTRALVGESIGAVYGAIRRVNQETGELISKLFESLEDHADVQHTLRRKESAESAEETDVTKPRRRRSS